MINKENIVPVHIEPTQKESGRGLPVTNTPTPKPPTKPPAPQPPKSAPKK